MNKPALRTFTCNVNGFSTSEYAGGDFHNGHHKIMNTLCGPLGHPTKAPRANMAAQAAGRMRIQEYVKQMVEDHGVSYLFDRHVELTLRVSVFEDGELKAQYECYYTLGCVIDRKQSKLVKRLPPEVK